MKQLILIFHLFGLPLYAYPQANIESKSDMNWLMGYSNHAHHLVPYLGGTKLSFSAGTVQVDYDSIAFNMEESSAILSDEQSNIICYTNGVYIADGTDTKLNPNSPLLSGVWNVNWGDRTPQNPLMLHVPNTDSIILLSIEIESFNGRLVGKRLYQHILSKSPVLQVLELNTLLLQDNMSYGQLTACRHANGRDWWILVMGYLNRKYHRFLLDPQGLHYLGYLLTDGNVDVGLGQAVFSPDGTKYCIYNGINVLTGNDIEIFDFDRCSGELSNQRHYHLIDSAYSAGAAISPNSRYLYVSSFRFVYQYDLQAPDIEASKDTIAVFDGFVDTIPNVVLGFYLAQLAPDNKIYINSPSSVKWMHVIETPDFPGDSCGMVQHGLELETLNAFSMPNFPFFRLGALDGSPCDTLGIDAWIGVRQPQVLAPSHPKLLAYPNPASTSCTIGLGRTLPQDGRMEVHDMSGRLIEAHALQRATIGYGLNTASWSAGSYVISVWCGGEWWGTIQIIVED